MSERVFCKPGSLTGRKCLIRTDEIVRFHDSAVVEPAVWTGGADQHGGVGGLDADTAKVLEGLARSAKPGADARRRLKPGIPSS